VIRNEISLCETLQMKRLKAWIYLIGITLLSLISVGCSGSCINLILKILFGKYAGVFD